RAVGFVHVGVGDQAWIGLGHPAQVTERGRPVVTGAGVDTRQNDGLVATVLWHAITVAGRAGARSEEHTSELSRVDIVCRLLLEKSAVAVIDTLSLHDALPIFAQLASSTSA